VDKIHLVYALMDLEIFSLLKIYCEIGERPDNYKLLLISNAQNDILNQDLFGLFSIDFLNLV
jgi:hypothetical protein